MAAESNASAMIDRLDAVELRLTALAARPAPSGRPPADASGEEAWQADQVWGHLAEMLPYWLRDARRIAVEGQDAPARFGRPETDPGRLDGIERFRRQPVTQTIQDLRQGMQELRDLLRGLDARAWSARAESPRFGTMDFGRFVDVVMVGHLEAHASQLEALHNASA